ncbi:hypothetical protein [Haliangium sp.]|uniref:hypothetical protein n=1 Tax=Haliangium sp. TaxID=2663208 RepID=UPI003D103B42
MKKPRLSVRVVILAVKKPRLSVRLVILAVKKPRLSVRLVILAVKKPRLSVRHAFFSVEEPRLSIRLVFFSVEEPRSSVRLVVLAVKEPRLSVRLVDLAVEEPRLSVCEAEAQRGSRLESRGPEESMGVQAASRSAPSKREEAWGSRRYREGRERKGARMPRPCRGEANADVVGGGSLARGESERRSCEAVRRSDHGLLWAGPRPVRSVENRLYPRADRRRE